MPCGAHSLDTSRRHHGACHLLLKPRILDEKDERVDTDANATRLPALPPCVGKDVNFFTNLSSLSIDRKTCHVTSLRTTGFARNAATVAAAAAAAAVVCRCRRDTRKRTDGSALEIPWHSLTAFWKSPCRHFLHCNVPFTVLLYDPILSVSWAFPFRGNVGSVSERQLVHVFTVSSDHPVDSFDSPYVASVVHVVVVDLFFLCRPYVTRIQ